MSESDISTFQDGKYTDDIRACFYELLSLNVGFIMLHQLFAVYFKMLHISLF